MKAEDNKFPYWTALAGAAPAAAPAGAARFYVDSADGHLHMVDAAGTTTTIGAPGSLDSLTDVDLTTTAPSTGDRLAFNGTNWVPMAPNSILLEAGQTVADYETANGVTVAPGTRIFQKG